MSRDASTANELAPALPGVHLLRRIGSGAYGQVWLGRNDVTLQLVAVKLIALADAKNGRAMRELASLQQFESSRRGRHQFLVDIHHAGQTDEFLYYLMDAADDVEGGPATASPSYRPATLAAVLERSPATIDDVMRWTDQLLSSLAFLHRHRLAHRDVKPANCMFFAGQLKLADYGLLTLVAPGVSMIGTPLYMPPDGRMDERADVYAAGLVIYEMLTGMPADSFPRPGPRLVNRRNDSRVIGLNPLILRACEKNPSDRFADAGRMLEAFHKINSTTVQKRSRRWLITSACVAAAACATSPLLLIHRVTGPPSPPITAVNFITTPYEADIYIDGTHVVDSSGQAMRTPCTVHDLTALPHHVVFRLASRSALDAGTIDFSRNREISFSWNRDKALSNDPRAVP